MSQTWVNEEANGYNFPTGLSSWPLEYSNFRSICAMSFHSSERAFLPLRRLTARSAVSGSGFWLGFIVPAIGGGQVAAWVPNSGLTGWSHMLIPLIQIDTSLLSRIVQVGMTAIFGLIADFGPVTRVS